MGVRPTVTDVRGEFHPGRGRGVGQANCNRCEGGIPSGAGEGGGAGQANCNRCEGGIPSWGGGGVRPTVIDVRGEFHAGRGVWVRPTDVRGEFHAGQRHVDMIMVIRDALT